MKRCLATMVVALVACHAPAWSTAQEGSSVRPYDGIQAGLDAYRLGEERRRSDFQQQMDLNGELRASASLPPWSADAMWYADAVRPSPGFGSGRGAVYVPQYRGYPVPIYDPWLGAAILPWGPSYTTPVRQPVGRWEGQTGPSRWESHPVYDPPLIPYRASPPVDSPWLDRTPYAAPQARWNEWGDGFEGRPDTEPSFLPTAPATEPGDTSETLRDDFDSPRKARAAPERSPPAPSRPRVREF